MRDTSRNMNKFSDKSLKDKKFAYALTTLRHYPMRRMLGLYIHGQNTQTK